MRGTTLVAMAGTLTAIPRGEGQYRLRRSKILSTSQARTGIAEAEHGLAPVHLVFERAPFLARDAIAVVAQPGTPLARDDRVEGARQRGGVRLKPKHDAGALLEVSGRSVPRRRISRGAQDLQRRRLQRLVGQPDPSDAAISGRTTSWIATSDSLLRQTSSRSLN